MGKHVSENLTLGAEVGVNAEDAALKARYHFGRHWDVEASPGVGSSSLDVMFNIDIK